MSTGVWSPGSEPPPPLSPERGKNTEKDVGIPPVWTPSSAGTSPVAERKEFRPVSFESPILSRRKKPQVRENMYAKAIVSDSISWIDIILSCVIFISAVTDQLKRDWHFKYIHIFPVLRLHQVFYRCSTLDLDRRGFTTPLEE